MIALPRCHSSLREQKAGWRVLCMHLLFFFPSLLLCGMLGGKTDIHGLYDLKAKLKYDQPSSWVQLRHCLSKHSASYKNTNNGRFCKTKIQMSFKFLLSAIYGKVMVLIRLRLWHMYYCQGRVRVR